jgi:hypothetical protein
VDEDQANNGAKQGIMDADARMAARLKKLIETPGISDKDRKQVERNLRRLLESQELRRGNQ